MRHSKTFRKIIKNATGMTPEQCSEIPLEVMFNRVEAACGRKIQCVPMGRGVLTSEESDRQFAEAISTLSNLDNRGQHQNFSQV